MENFRKRQHNDKNEQNEDGDLEETDEADQQSAIDGSRDAGNSELAYVVEELTRNVRHVLVVDEKDEIVVPPAVRTGSDIVHGGLACRLKSAVHLHRRRLVRRRRQLLLDARLHRCEECLVLFQVLLFDVLESVVAVDDEKDEQRDVRQKLSGVNDDAHHREDDDLDEAADALGHDDQRRYERRHAEDQNGDVVEALLELDE